MSALFLHSSGNHNHCLDAMFVTNTAEEAAENLKSHKKAEETWNWHLSLIYPQPHSRELEIKLSPSLSASFSLSAHVFNNFLWQHGKLGSLLAGGSVDSVLPCYTRPLLIFNVVLSVWGSHSMMLIMSTEDSFAQIPLKPLQLFNDLFSVLIVLTFSCSRVASGCVGLINSCCGHRCRESVVT